MSCLQGFYYWPSACRVVGREDLIADERFTSHELLAANAGVAREILTSVFASAPLAEWRERLASFDGQWSIAQDSLEVVEDPQVVANSYLGETINAAGIPFNLVTVPVQFGVLRHTSPSTRIQRALRRDPREHRLGPRGVLELKIEGVVA